MSIVINFFAAPGVGKSTNSARLFTMLKDDKISCELVPEFAKDLTWEENYNALKCQLYVSGEQLYRIERLSSKVDFIITDSPFVLGAIYGNDSWYMQEHLNEYLKLKHLSMKTINVFLHRKKDYVQIGRTQTLEESNEIQERIYKLFTDLNVRDNRKNLYIEIDGDIKGVKRLYEIIKNIKAML